MDNKKRELNGWISTKRFLPKTNQNVLAVTNKGRCVITWVDSGHKELDFDAIDIEEGEVFTHWMTLPPAPGTALTSQSDKDGVISEMQKDILELRNALTNIYRASGKSKGIGIGSIAFAALESTKHYGK